MDDGEIAIVFRRLAIEAGRETLKHFRREGLDVERKADDSPVTAADRAADAVIVDGLRAALPDLPVVTEERPETHAAAAPAGRYALVDPLDGTKEFVSGRGDYTVNIGLIDGGAPVLGVVYAPAKGRLFWTPERGAAVEESGEPDPAQATAMRPIQVADADPSALRIVASKSHQNAETADYVARYPLGQLVNAGSSLKFCLVAAGEADLYPRLGPTMEWDTAAGHAVLLSAGGRVDALSAPTAAPDGPLRYGKPDLRNGWFAAYAPTVTLRTEQGDA